MYSKILLKYLLKTDGTVWCCENKLLFYKLYYYVPSACLLFEQCGHVVT